ncbi:alkaline phosphatase D family protein [Nitratireductor pacificus]|uniref:Phosphodiesterase/alkaline phosphatase D n=1 Tax=Nitratireductor pacificus pht-3B TaxID=391937 RepID=K2MDH0_9HYPH|nr:alkaline phosphatase D family protein [Nitratireductor pacificus]EKF20221.1 phosphodiesterase/alkaline phosphatase D [Nitratireductor pacificus pht-3B]
MKRRDLLIGGMGLGATLAMPRLAFGQTARFDRDPFQLGVSSGEPTSTSITLWTRLAPDPLVPGGGLEPRPYAVDWVLASDEALGAPVARGTAIATPEMAHSVRVTVQGLQPGRHYWYRFTVGDATSVTGRTKTLPDLRLSTGQVRFATASCQHFEQGLFVAYDHMVEDDVDFVLHLGDYIYGVSRGEFRHHTRKDVPVTLEDYRLRHALYKTDPHLQKAHASFPFMAVMDNHDALKDVDLTPEALAQRAAAYQAWFEHMPMAGGYTAGSRSIYTHGSLDFGDLLRLNILDTRQFRDNEDLCREAADPDYGFTIYRPACADVTAPGRTTLGAAQEAWIADRFATSRQRWNATASSVLFAPFAMQHGGDTFRYESSWDYYPENRKRLIGAMKETGLSNPVVLSADIHSNWAIDIPEDPDEPESAPIGSEMLATSISSGWPQPLDAPMKDNLTYNPHVHHYDSSQRGYMLHDVTPESWTTAMRVVDTIESAQAKVSNQARFAIEHGKAGVQKA